MKRRDFLKSAGPATILPFLVGGFSMKAFANTPFFQTLLPASNGSDRVLVLIQLIGGNDGLQTLIPLDAYDALVAARGNIVIPQKDIVGLTDTLGLHPNFSAMKKLFNDGKLGIVQNVGYPQPNFSHFRSIDIWLSGANYDELLTTGWLGRYLDQEYPGFPSGYPNSSMPDPIAIQIGAAVSLALEGQNGSMGMVFSDSTSFNNIINDTVTSTPNTRAGHELAYIRSIGKQLQTFAAPVKTAAGKGKILSTEWPTAGDNSLADQLRIVSQLIVGGLKTKIYVVSLGGFDSHTDQRANQDPLLLKVAGAVTAFQDELRLQSLEDRVIGMTFSEFGRRILSNDSLGTDHGAAAPMFIFGSQVIPGIQGHNPKIPDKVTVEDNLPMQFDFRQIYASVLKQWFTSSDAEITNTLLSPYQTIPIIKQQAGLAVGTPIATPELLQNYPNPCRGVTNISFRTAGGRATLKIFDLKGSTLRTLFDGSVSAGEKTVSFDTNNLHSGSYFYSLKLDGATLTKEMQVIR